MDTYVGLDVSLRETAVCVVDESGAIQLERTVAADPDVIAALLQAQGHDVVGITLQQWPRGESDESARNGGCCSL